VICLVAGVFHSNEDSGGLRGQQSRILWNRTKMRRRSRLAVLKTLPAELTSYFKKENKFKVVDTCQFEKT
jgi:hypothetical protein